MERLSGKRSGRAGLVEYFIGGGQRFPSRYRALEVAFCATYIYCVGYAALEVWAAFRHFGNSWLLVPPLVLLAHLTSDVFSGFVHWAADTYGSRKTPFLGPKFIAPFREHHEDPLAITRHDFVEANGDNCLCALSVLLPGYLLYPPHQSAWSAAFGVYLVVLAVSVLFTSIAHGWAHMERPPWVASFLQRIGLFITRDHHALHHSGPHTTHYCITAGWLNPVFDKLRVFRRIERVLARLGIHPAERKG